jgi:hypothetical protein
VTGWEEFTVWLFGILMAAVTVQQVAKARADARVAVARASAEVWLQAQEARAPLFPPTAWSREADQ